VRSLLGAVRPLPVHVVGLNMELTSSRRVQVKCDERPDGCANCERLSIACSPAEGNSQRSSPSSSVTNHEILTEAGIDRRRAFRACEACRSAKTRCTAELPRCHRCINRSLECLYLHKAAPQWVNRTRRNTKVRGSVDNRQPSADSLDEELSAREGSLIGETSSASPNQCRESSKDCGLDW
jgi:hypothetical protein